MDKIREAIEIIGLENWLSNYDEVEPTSSPQEIRLKSCPACGKSKSKVYINVEKQAWHCKHCNWGEGVGDICILLAGVSGRSVEDVRQELLNHSIPSLPTEIYLDKLQNSLFAPEIEPVIEEKIETVDVPGSDSLSGIVGKRVIQYATNRGLIEDDIYKYKLRAAAKINKFLGPFLVFPLNYGPKAVSWQGRRISDSEPRYVSSKQIANWLWPLDEVHKAVIEEKRTVVLCEGLFDSIAFWRYERPALCTFGKKITNNQILLLSSLKVKEVVLAWDPDAASEIESASKTLKAIFPVVSVANVSQKYHKEIKLDAGLALQYPELSIWLQEQVDNAINVDSSEFFNWKLKRRLQ